MAKDKYHYSIGRRKTASATVRLYPTKGESEVNAKKLEEAFPAKFDQLRIVDVFKSADLDSSNFYFTAKVKGGGSSAQLQAVMHGLARAIIKMDPELKKLIKKSGYLTRDPRMVERKKPGLHKARKAEQFSKR